MIPSDDSLGKSFAHNLTSIQQDRPPDASNVLRETQKMPI
jgi:hypothetical protein